MLTPHYYINKVEAGCDEAGRGCLAGSVYAAAVILPDGYDNPELNDSKQLTVKKRYELRQQIERDAVAWAIGIVTPEDIDKINILKASFLAMHRALDSQKLKRAYELKTFHDKQLANQTLQNVNLLYQAIAAASILAKTYRDDYMDELDARYPMYDWKSNKGYPTKKHRQGIRDFGISPFHRKSYNLLGTQEMFLDF